MGLLLGNIIDFDHILLGLNKTVPWLGNIYNTDIFWNCNGFFGYPPHTVYVMISLIVLSVILFVLMKKEKELKINGWMFWICNGALLNLILDFIQLSTGVGFVIHG